MDPLATCSYITGLSVSRVCTEYEYSMGTYLGAQTPGPLCLGSMAACAPVQAPSSFRSGFSPLPILVAGQSAMASGG